jgi:L-glyceraldehyde 3-phosphate reductase
MTYAAEPQRYDAMRYNRCGASGLKLPALSLGLWHSFGGVDSPSNARTLILHAFDRGITHFDLANNYGPPPGSAEETFGNILAGDLAAHRDELVISTKAGYRMWPGPYGEWGSLKYLTASLDQSLRRMRLDYVDIFYSHRPDPETPLEETMEALVRAVRAGKALYIGVSSYPPEMTRRAAALLRGMGVRCLVHQPKYSLYERGIERGLLDVLASEGIGCVAFSPLAQGLLTDRYLDGIPADSRAASPHGYLRRHQVTDAVIQASRALRDIARARGETLARMALAWALRDPRVTSLVIGASRTAQIDENLGALHSPPFTEQQLREIDRITATVHIPPREHPPG